jgi:hypothetical protein
VLGSKVAHRLALTAWPKDQNGPGGLAGRRGVLRPARGHHVRGSQGGAAPGGSSTGDGARGGQGEQEGSQGNVSGKVCGDVAQQGPPTSVGWRRSFRRWCSGTVEVHQWSAVATSRPWSTEE